MPWPAIDTWIYIIPMLSSPLQREYCLHHIRQASTHFKSSTHASLFSNNWQNIKTFVRNFLKLEVHVRPEASTSCLFIRISWHKHNFTFVDWDYVSDDADHCPYHARNGFGRSSIHMFSHLSASIMLKMTEIISLIFQIALSNYLIPKYSVWCCPLLWSISC